MIVHAVRKAAGALLGMSLLMSTIFTGLALADGKQPGLKNFIAPLRAQAGPVLSLPLGAIPTTEIWASMGFRYGTYDRGLATYKVVQTALVLGGEWSPSSLDRLGLGGSITAFTSTTLMIDLPPAIDEKSTYFDLGLMEIHGRFRILELKWRGPDKKWPLELALTPFFRLGLPTDTSRIREDRHMPIRGVIDDRVIDGPYFLIEPGAALGVTLGVFCVYTHQGVLFAPIHGQDKTHVFYSMHYGLGARIAGLVEIVVEANGLMRFTENIAHERLAAWAVSPGVRLVLDSASLELSSRLGLGNDAYDPYGDVTLGLTFGWKFQGV